MQGVEYFGPCVNCAARIEGLAAGGQNLISTDTYALVSEMEGVVFEFLGNFTLKACRQVGWGRGMWFWTTVMIAGAIVRRLHNATCICRDENVHSRSGF